MKAAYEANASNYYLCKYFFPVTQYMSLAI